MVKTILFDLDGTLLDTLDDLHNSVNYALSTENFQPREREEIRRFLGNGIRNLIAQCCGEKASSTQQESVFSIFRQHYLEHSLERTAPYGGIIPLLEELRHRGIKMGIVSNKVDAAVKELNRHFFTPYMDIAIGECEQRERKPSPEALYYAMEQLGARKEETLYVGDSEVDHHTARSAGVRSILVLWGFRDEANLKQLEADAYLNCPADLIQLL